MIPGVVSRVAGEQWPPEPGAAAGAASWQTLDFNDNVGTSLGSGGILTSLQRVVVNGQVGIAATFNGALSAGTLGSSGYVVFPLKDCFGNALANVSANQGVLFMVQLLDTALPGACRIGVSLQDGTGASPTNGMYAGVEKHVTNGYFAQRSQSPGTGIWAAPTSASSADHIARSWMGKLLRGNAAGSVALNVHPIDGSRQPSRVAASATAVYTGAGGADYTHLVVRFGCSAAMGGTPTVRVAVKAFIYDLRTAPLTYPFALPTPAIVKPANGQPYDFAIVGHSKANGFYPDPTYAGLGVAAGWSFYDDNVLLANWPTGAGFEQSVLPRMIVELGALGVTGSTIHRRATNGQKITDAGFDAEVGQIVADMFNRGVTPKAFLVWHGANDATTTTDRDAFLGRLRLIVEIIRLYYPDAAIVLLGEHVTNVSYPYITDVQAHKVTVAGEYPGVYFVSATSPSNITLGADNIHPDAGGNTTMAARTVAQLAA